MKKVYLVLFVAFSLLVTSFSTCENDEFDPDPNADARDDIAIKWNCEAYEVTDAGQTFAGSYEVLIKKSETVDNEIILTNFNNWGDASEVVAILTSSTITFKTQTVEGYNLTGDGTISDQIQEITWDYTLDDGIEILNYKATFSPSSISKKRGI